MHAEQLERLMQAWRAAGRTLVRAFEAVERARGAYEGGPEAFEADLVDTQTILEAAIDLAQSAVPPIEWVSQQRQRAGDEYEADDTNLDAELGAIDAARALARSLASVLRPPQREYEDDFEVSQPLWDALQRSATMEDGERYAAEWRRVPETAHTIRKVLDAAEAETPEWDDADRAQFESDVHDLLTD